MSQQTPPTSTKTGNSHPVNASGNPPRTTRYMWILTLQKPMRGGFANHTSFGTYDAPSDASRNAIYTELLRLCQERAGFDGANVLFFSLELDRLGGAGR